MKLRAPADGRGAWLALLAGILCVPLPGRVRAQQLVGSDQCCAQILFPIGARSVALGRATVALGGAESVFSNPAGLAEVSQGQFWVHHRQEVGGQLNGLVLLMRPSGIGTFGLTYELNDEGSQEYTDQNGNVVGSFFIQEHMLFASFATSLGSAVDAGLSYKLYYLANSCGACGGLQSSTTSLIDLGVQVRPPQVPGLELGLALANAGLPLQVINYEQADKPPRRIRVGAAYEVLHAFHADTMLALRISAQLEGGNPAPRPTVASIGAEFSVAGALFLRVGYDGSLQMQDSGLAMGVGFQYDRFSVAVAKAFSGTPLEPQPPPHLSLGISF